MSWCNSITFWINERIATQMYDMGRATDGSSHSVFSIDVMDIFLMGVDSQNMWVWPFGFGPLQVKRYNRSLCLSVLCKACRAWRGSDKWKSRLLYMFFFSPWFPILWCILCSFCLLNFEAGGLRATNHTIHNLRQSFTSATARACAVTSFFPSRVFSDDLLTNCC